MPAPKPIEKPKEKTNVCLFFYFWGPVPGFVSWVLGIVSWVLGLVFWVLGFVCWVLEIVCWVLGIVCWVLSPSNRGGRASSRLDHGLKVELDPYIKGPKRQKSIDSLYFFGRFSKYVAPRGAKYREKGGFVTNTGEGRSTNPFWNF